MLSFLFAILFLSFSTIYSPAEPHGVVARRGRKKTVSQPTSRHARLCRLRMTRPGQSLRRVLYRQHGLRGPYLSKLKGAFRGQQGPRCQQALSASTAEVDSRPTGHILLLGLSLAAQHFHPSCLLLPVFSPRPTIAYQREPCKKRADDGDQGRSRFFHRQRINGGGGTFQKWQIICCQF